MPYTYPGTWLRYLDPDGTWIAFLACNYRTYMFHERSWTGAVVRQPGVGYPPVPGSYRTGERCP